jgi:hypothetical protein
VSGATPMMWASWLPWWLVLRLLLGTKVGAEATATTVRSEGFARAEATRDCVELLHIACIERRYDRDEEPGVADSCGTDDDGLVTCVVVCWGDCAIPADE